MHILYYPPQAFESNGFLLMIAGAGVEGLLAIRVTGRVEGA